MREEMGMTQAEFARQLGVALPAVGRWESYTPPTGLKLKRLALTAENNGFDSVATTFRYALEREPGGGLATWVRLRSEGESMCVAAVLDVRGGVDPELAQLRPALARLLKAAIEARKTAVGFKCR